MLPTAPFLEKSDLKEGFNQLSRSIDSVVSLLLTNFPINDIIIQDDHTM